MGARRKEEVEVYSHRRIRCIVVGRIRGRIGSSKGESIGHCCCLKVSSRSVPRRLLPTAVDGCEPKFKPQINQPRQCVWYILSAIPYAHHNVDRGGLASQWLEMPSYTPSVIKRHADLSNVQDHSDRDDLGRTMCLKALRQGAVFSCNGGITVWEKRCSC